MVKKAVKQPLLAITGNAGHGKDTVAASLIAKLTRTGQGFPVQQFALADPLKKCVAGIFNIPEVLLYTESGKARALFPNYGPKTGRDALVELSACIKSFYPDIWLEKSRRNIEQWIHQGIYFYANEGIDVKAFLPVVSDVRTQHELDYLRAFFDVTLLKVVRPNPPYPPETYLSAMEIEIPNLQADITVNNNGSLEDLEETLKEVYKEVVRTCRFA